jgi:hypothetical protein
MKKADPKFRDLETTSTIALACLVFFVLSHKVWLLSLAVVLLIVGLFFKKTSSIISKYWLSLSEGIGKVTNKIILGILFFGFLTPISVLYRLARGERMGVAAKNGGTQWVTLNKEYTKSSLENMW